MAEKVKLQPKDQSSFKKAMKLYDERQYHRALRDIDAILVTYPKHADSMGLKGLILYAQNKKTEGFDWVKKGIANDYSSYLCWQCYGMLHRAEKNYGEAAKCFRRAVSLDADKSNELTNLRDLSVLEIQTRDITGFVNSRRSMLQLKPALKANWVAVVVGEHLNGHYDEALSTLTTFLGASKLPAEVRRNTADEIELATAHSELYLYHNWLLQEAGKLKEALAHFDTVEKYCFDVLWIKEKRAEINLKLGNFEEAKKLYNELVDINQEQYHYHKGLQDAYQVSSGSAEAVAKLAALYDELEKKYPKSQTIVRIPLNFVQGKEFETRVEKYVKSRLRKGVPSLFVDLKPLLSDAQKCSAIDSLFSKMEKSLVSAGTFPNEQQKEAPSVLLWTRMFDAQLRDFLGVSNASFEQTQLALQHTPTLIEIHMIDARTHKHSGNVHKAAAAFEVARSMDLADRYLNTKSAIYLLRSGRITTALSLVGMFIKEKEGENPVAHLMDFQANWFAQELGMAYWRAGEIGKGLKKLVGIEKHFQTFVDDQFEFHGFCLRKCTLRSYVSMLRFQDRGQAHKFYIAAARSIIIIYLSMYDTPVVDEPEEDAELAGLSEEEKKKALKKKKKEELKRNEEKAKKGNKKASNNSNKDKEEKDDDPDGHKLKSVASPLNEAAARVAVLQQFAPKDLQTQLLAFEVFIRKGKYLLALQSLLRSYAITNAQSHPLVFKNVVRFFLALQTAQVSPLVKELIEENKSKLLQNAKSVEEFNKTFTEAHKNSHTHRIASAEVLLLLNPNAKAEALTLLTNITGPVGYKGMKDCMRAYDVIKTTLKDQKAASEFKKKVSVVYPHATFFQETNPLTHESLKEQGTDGIWSAVSGKFIDYLSPKLKYMQ